MSALAQTLALAGKELKVLLRDRQALVLLFAMPAVFIFFLSFALRDVFNEKVGGTMPVVVAVEDDGPPAARLAARLRARPELRIIAPDPDASDRDLFAKGEAKASIRIPQGFSDDLDAWVRGRGRDAFGTHRVVWDVDPTLDAAYRWFPGGEPRLRDPGRNPRRPGLLRRHSTSRHPSLRGHSSRGAAGGHASRGPRRTPSRSTPRAFLAAAPQPASSRVVPTPLQQTVPGWSLFSMFFIASRSRAASFASGRRGP
jgi:hypothetical protein